MLSPQGSESSARRSTGNTAVAGTDAVICTSGWARLAQRGFVPMATPTGIVHAAASTSAMVVRKKVAAALTNTGTMLSAFENAQQIGSVEKEAAQKKLSAASEADIFEATSNLVQAQQSLESALAVTCKTFGLTLLDYLK